MMHEYRTYTLYPHLFARYCDLAERKAIPIRKDDYGRLVAFWASESGTLCQVHHIWEYPDVNERNAERARMVRNDRWMTEFIADAWPTMIRQQVRFMYPASALAVPEGANLYESRIYRTVVGRFREVAEAVTARPRPEGAILAGCYTSESPEPNEVVEIVAYPDAGPRLASGMAEAEWLASTGADLLGVESTLLRPLPMSPMK